MLADAATGPFTVTISLMLAITIYLVLGPAHAVKKLMQLTKMSWDFELALIGLGIVYLPLAYGSERYVFPRLVRTLGRLRQMITQMPKQRKSYKTIQEAMRI